MIIIVGKKDHKMMNFVQNFIENYLIIDNVCEIKTIKEKVKIIVPFSVLKDNGVFSDTSIWFEELLMVLNVEEVLINKKVNEKLIDQICLLYQVPYRFFNF